MIHEAEAVVASETREDCTTILIVDDSRPSLQALRNLLDDDQYRILVATSGTSAQKVCEKLTPDLILLDVLMNEMDGFDLCLWLKGDERLSDVPVLFITALTSHSSLLRAFEVGGVDYITKPFRESEVLARVRAHLKIRELTRQLKERNQELESRSAELREAMDHVKTLSGLIPICCECKNIRDDQGYWKVVEEYISEHSEARFSHGICPECIRKLYPDVADD